MKKNKKILILGGGLSSLAAATILKKHTNADITILEKNNYFGGLAASFKKSNFEIPLYYHHVIESNKITIKYLKKYNLLKGVTWKKIKLAIANKGKLFNINEIKGLLTYNDLSLWGKFRFGLFGIYALFLMNPDKIHSRLDSYTWLKKYAGSEVTKKVFYNLYARNKFNISLRKISAQQFAHRLHEKEVYD